MPKPTESDLHARAMSHVAAGPSKFDPLTLLVLGAILSAVISHLVSKCLNHIDPVTARDPGFIRRWQLRRLVRQQCGDASVLRVATPDGLDAKAIDRKLGDAAYDALLKTGAALSPMEAIGLCRE